MKKLDAMTTSPAAPKPPDVPAALEAAAFGDGPLSGLELARVALGPEDVSERVAPELRLEEVTLRGVDLTGVHAPGASLTDVLVRDGSWANAVLSRGTLTRVEAKGLRATGVELAEAHLHDVFEDCRLDLSSLRFARLERVVFRDCRLEEADLHGATLTSVLFERSNLTGATVSAATFERCEVRGCELEGLQGAERLRGVRMPWPDVVQIAGLLAGTVGIEIVD